MNYEPFVNEWNGKSIDWDGQFGAQCVDLAAQYCIENNLPVAYANAADWWENPSLVNAFDFIKYDGSQVPPKGAILIYRSDLPGSGGAGHIEIFDHIVSPNVYVSFSQNWGGMYCHFVTHSGWDYVIGWMIPKTNQGDDMIQDKDNEYSRVNDLMLKVRGRTLSRDEFRQYIVGQTWLHMVEILSDDPEAIGTQHAQEVGQLAIKDNWEGQIYGLQDQLKKLQDAINQQNQVITDITNDKNATKASYQAAIIKLADLNAQLTTAHDKITDLQKQPAQDSQLLNDTGNIFQRLFKRLFK